MEDQLLLKIIPIAVATILAIVFICVCGDNGNPLLGVHVEKTSTVRRATVYILWQAVYKQETTL